MKKNPLFWYCRLDAFMAWVGQARDVTACTAPSSEVGALFVNTWYLLWDRCFLWTDFLAFSPVSAGIDCGFWEKNLSRNWSQLLSIGPSAFCCFLVWQALGTVTRVLKPVAVPTLFAKDHTKFPQVSTLLSVNPVGVHVVTLLWSTLLGNSMQFSGTVASAIGKKLTAITQKRTCEDLKPWLQSIINHVPWAASSTPAANGELIVRKWGSVERNIQNIHTNHGEWFP